MDKTVYIVENGISYEIEADEKQLYEILQKNYNVRLPNGTYLIYKDYNKVAPYIKRLLFQYNILDVEKFFKKGYVFSLFSFIFVLVLFLAFILGTLFINSKTNKTIEAVEKIKENIALIQSDLKEIKANPLLERYKTFKKEQKNLENKGKENGDNTTTASE